MLENNIFYYWNISRKNFLLILLHNIFLNLIYEFLGEEPYEHDFDNIKSEYADTDIVKYGIQDITKIRSMLKSTSQDPKKILPEEVYNMCKGTEFWRDDE